MKNKLVYLVIFAVALSSLAVVSAADSNDFTVKGDILTVQGVEFNMPEGFHIWDAMSSVDNTQKTANCFLTNDTSDGLILISVWFDKKYDKLEEVTGPNTTINGVTGATTEMKSGNVDQSVFAYLVDGKQVVVMVHKGHENLFSKVVKK